MVEGTHLIFKSQEDRLISSLLYADYRIFNSGLNIRLGIKPPAQITRESP